MSVALYCRVSTEEQAVSGFSIEHQKERLIAYCKSQGWDTFSIYVDDGCTGTNLDRPQMQRLIRDVQSGLINTVLVYKLDRLSRKQKDVLYLLEDLFERHQVVFRSATEPFDTSTSLGRAMIGILAVFGQLERDTIVERTKSGKYQRTRRGLWYGGPVPYGYRWSQESQRLQIMPIQAMHIQEMFSQFIAGKSYSAIGSWLAKRADDREFSHHKTVQYMLTNPIYAGFLHQDGILVTGLHEAIVDEDTWHAAQAEVERRKSRRSTGGKYLLSHLLQCGVCGASMKHVLTKDRRRNRVVERGYYVCSRKHQQGKLCCSRWHADKPLEQAVIRTLSELVLDDEEFHQVQIKPMQAFGDNALVEMNLKQLLKETNQRLQRWYSAFEEGTIDLNLLHQRIEKLEQKRNSIECELRDLSVMQNDCHEINPIRLENCWDLFTHEEQQTVLRMAFSQIIVHHDSSIRVTWNV